MQLFTFASQHSMIWVSYGEKDDLATNGKVGDPIINRMGASIGAMAQSDDVPAGKPPQGVTECETLVGVLQSTTQFTFYDKH